MGSDLNKMVIDLPCSNCKRQFKVKLGILKMGAEVRCPHCKAINKIADKTWEKVKQELQDFSKKLKRGQVQRSN